MAALAAVVGKFKAGQGAVDATGSGSDDAVLSESEDVPVKSLAEKSASTGPLAAPQVDGSSLRSLRSMEVASGVLDGRLIHFIPASLQRRPIRCS